MFSSGSYENNKVNEANQLILKAQDDAKKARDADNHKNHSHALEFYTSAIRCYQKVISWNIAEIRCYEALYKLYEDRAICYFNTSMFTEAASSFLEAFGMLVNTYELKTVFNEVFYRSMIKLFINLADTYNALSNAELAEEALKYSIKAFTKIAELGRLTKQEALLLSKPNLAQAMYAFYEEQISYPVFTSSKTFKVQTKILLQCHEESKKNEEIENNLSTKISRSELQDNEPDFLKDRSNDNVDSKLGERKTSLTNDELMMWKKLPEYFTQQLRAQESDNLNKLAIKYKNHGDDYFSKGRDYFKYAIESYQLAITALKKITDQSVEVNKKIEYLSKCIENLNKQLQIPVQSFGMVNSVGLFSHHNQSTVPVPNVSEQQQSIVEMEM